MPLKEYPDPASIYESLPRRLWREAACGELQPIDNIITPEINTQPPKTESQANEDNEQLSAQGYIPHTELYGGLWSNASLVVPSVYAQLTPQRSTKASPVPPETY